MMMPLTRRRFITISAGALAAGLIPATGLMAAPAPVRWRGIAMGARAELILAHPDRKKAETALQVVHDEIRRLESVFSLYDPRSALSQLNKASVLHSPPLDLIRCLDDASAISRVTDGAFDVTVQPLWQLYARHFAKAATRSDGPGAAELAAARALVDHKAVQIDPERIYFSKPGMAVTLNGIAQGYITDRAADLLKAHGFENVLIDLGETRGMGQRHDGDDWRVGIKAPDGSGKLIEKLELRNKAIATSGGYGTRFTADGVHHHLFDPKTGRSTDKWTSMSVIADDATRADALSTAFSSLPESRIRQVSADMNVSVIAFNGSRRTI